MIDFKPPRGLRGGHVQSVLASTALRRLLVLRRARPMLGHAVDEIVDCGEGTRLLLHHASPRDEAAGKLVVLIHGWEGSADSSYLLSAAVRLWDEGYRVIRLNLRDHGASHHLNPELFHSCRLDEVVGAVCRIRQRFPAESVYLAGFSLGGNFVLRIAARAQQAGLDLSAVTAVCPVLDPNETMEALETGYFFYHDYFIRKWRRSLSRKKAAFPEIYDFENLRQFRSLQQMTDYFVRHYTEFPDLSTYLNGYALTGDVLAGIAAPAAILLAEDDPVIPVSALERIAKPRSLVVHRSPHGGHCGFISDYRLTSWLDDYIVRSFQRDALAG